MTTSVVIPAYGDRGLLDALLLRLDNYCSESIDEIVIVDNGNHWKEAETIGKEVWIHLPQNIGFGPAVNLGVARSKHDLILVISTDVEFAEDVVYECKQIYENNDMALIGGKLWDTDTGWNICEGKLFPYLEGWFLFFDRDLWEEIGGFSPEFYPYDYEDIDFSTKAIKYLGIELVEVRAPTLKHLGGRTIGYNPEREAVTKEHRKVFEEKWMGI